jgi:hypothetical protein
LESSPSEGGAFAVFELGDGFIRNPSTCEPINSIESLLGVIDIGQFLSVLEINVVGQQIVEVAIIVSELIVPFKTIIFNPESFEPWASRYLLMSCEVTFR